LGKQLIVVNDDPEFIRLIEVVMSDRNWDVIGIHEGSMALESIKRHEPDVVLLDVRMEVPDAGWNVLNLLVLDPETRAIPVIMCSADWGQLNEKAVWLHDRGVEILPRPFDIDDLYSMIERVEQSTRHKVREKNTTPSQE
jgi:CheY-like chemotaxis protein